MLPMSVNVQVTAGGYQDFDPVLHEDALQHIVIEQEVLEPVLGAAFLYENVHGVLLGLPPELLLGSLDQLLTCHLPLSQLLLLEQLQLEVLQDLNLFGQVGLVATSLEHHRLALVLLLET